MVMLTYWSEYFEAESRTIPRSVICATTESVVEIMNSDITAYLGKAFPISLKRECPRDSNVSRDAKFRGLMATKMRMHSL
jgi:hypothetical protein